VEQYEGTGRRLERRERRQPFAEPGSAGRERKAARGVRRELERIEIAGEHEARRRAWEVVQAAYSEREPAPPHRSWRPVALGIAVAALLAAALSPPGMAVLSEVRDAVLPTRVERVERALFSLPAPGRLLVVSAERGGVWVVRADGSRRRLGDYDDARWSPRGRFIVATRRNALVALTPEGEERWSLARRNVGLVAWGGTRADTRVAYTARSGLRVVDGDGTNDRLLHAGGDLGPLAWHPGPGHELLYLADGVLRLQQVDSRRVLWRREAPPFAPRSLSWSADGERALVAYGSELQILDARGRLVRRLQLKKLEVVSASFARSGRQIGVLLREPGTVGASTRTVVRLVDADRAGRSRELFSGRGDFGELAWSPDGRHLLVAWRSADRWLFINRSTRYAIAVEGVGEQFPRPDGRPPLLLVSDRWIAPCCAG
jgi:hypothetical protein